MADKQQVLDEIGDSIVRMQNALQGGTIGEGADELAIRYTAVLALAYAHIESGAPQLTINAGPAPTPGPVSP